MWKRRWSRECLRVPREHGDGCWGLSWEVMPVALLSLLLETLVLPVGPWTLNEAFHCGRISEEVDPSSHGCKCLVSLVSAPLPRLGLV